MTRLAAVAWALIVATVASLCRASPDLTLLYVNGHTALTTAPVLIDTFAGIGSSVRLIVTQGPAESDDDDDDDDDYVVNATAVRLLTADLATPMVLGDTAAPPPATDDWCAESSPRAPVANVTAGSAVYNLSLPVAPGVALHRAYPLCFGETFVGAVLRRVKTPGIPALSGPIAIPYRATLNPWSMSFTVRLVEPRHASEIYLATVEDGCSAPLVYLVTKPKADEPKALTVTMESTAIDASTMPSTPRLVLCIASAPMNVTFPLLRDLSLNSAVLGVVVPATSESGPLYRNASIGVGRELSRRIATGFTETLAALVEDVADVYPCDEANPAAVAPGFTSTWVAPKRRLKATPNASAPLRSFLCARLNSVVPPVVLPVTVLVVAPEGASGAAGHVAAITMMDGSPVRDVGQSTPPGVALFAGSGRRVLLSGTRLNAVASWRVLIFAASTTCTMATATEAAADHVLTPMVLSATAALLELPASASGAVFPSVCLRAADTLGTFAVAATTLHLRVLPLSGFAATLGGTPQTSSMVGMAGVPLKYYVSGTVSAGMSFYMAARCVLNGTVMPTTTEVGWTIVNAPTTAAGGLYQLCVVDSTATPASRTGFAPLAIASTARVLATGVQISFADMSVNSLATGSGSNLGHYVGSALSMDVAGSGYTALLLNFFLAQAACINGPQPGLSASGLPLYSVPVTKCGSSTARAEFPAPTGTTAAPLRLCLQVTSAAFPSAMASVDTGLTVTVSNPDTLVVVKDVGSTLSSGGDISQQPVLGLRDSSSGVLLSSIPWAANITAQWFVVAPAAAAGPIAGASVTLSVGTTDSLVLFERHPITFLGARYGLTYRLQFTASRPGITSAYSANVTLEDCANSDLWAVRYTATCQACPGEATCNGTQHVVVSGQSWRPDPFSERFFSCSTPFAGDTCAPGTATGACREGHFGPRCSECLDGYGKSIDECLVCRDNKAMDYIVITIAVVLLAFFFVWIVYLTLDSRKSDQLPIYLKVFISHITVSSTIGEISLEVPEFFKQFWSIQKQSSRPTIEYSSFDCVMGLSWHQKYILVNCFPVIVFVLVIPLLIYRTVRRCGVGSSSSRRRSSAMLAQQRRRASQHIVATQAKKEDETRALMDTTRSPGSSGPKGSPATPPPLAMTSMSSAAPTSAAASPNLGANRKRQVFFSGDSASTTAGGTPAASPDAVPTDLARDSSGVAPTASSIAAAAGAALSEAADALTPRPRPTTAASVLSREDVVIDQIEEEDSARDQHAEGKRDDEIDPTLLVGDAAARHKRASLVLQHAVERRRNNFHFLTILFTAVLFYAYPALVSWSGRALRCDTIDYSMRRPDGTMAREERTFFFFDRTLDCYSFENTQYRIAAAVFGSVWGLGIPLGFPVLFLWLKKQFGRTIASRMLTFAVAGYRRKMWWWETAMLFRKLALFAVVIFVEDTRLQTLLCFWILALHLVAHMVVAPYEYRRVDIMEQASLFVLCGTLNLSLLFDFLNFRSQTFWLRFGGYALTVFILLLNAGVVLWMLYVIITEALASLRREIRNAAARVDSYLPRCLTDRLFVWAYSDFAHAQGAMGDNIEEARAALLGLQNAAAAEGGAHGNIIVVDESDASDWSDDNSDDDTGDFDLPHGNSIGGGLVALEESGPGAFASGPFNPDDDTTSDWSTDTDSSAAEDEDLEVSPEQRLSKLLHRIATSTRPQTLAALAEELKIVLEEGKGLNHLRAIAPPSMPPIDFTKAQSGPNAAEHEAQLQEAAQRAEQLQKELEVATDFGRTTEEQLRMQVQTMEQVDATFTRLSAENDALRSQLEAAGESAASKPLGEMDEEEGANFGLTLFRRKLGDWREWLDDSGKQRERRMKMIILQGDIDHGRMTAAEIKERMAQNERLAERLAAKRAERRQRRGDRRKTRAQSAARRRFSGTPGGLPPLGLGRTSAQPSLARVSAESRSTFAGTCHSFPPAPESPQHSLVLVAPRDAEAQAVRSMTSFGARRQSRVLLHVDTASSRGDYDDDDQELVTPRVAPPLARTGTGISSTAAVSPSAAGHAEGPVVFFPNHSAQTVGVDEHGKQVIVVRRNKPEKMGVETARRRTRLLGSAAPTRAAARLGVAAPQESPRRYTRAE